MSEEKVTAEDVKEVVRRYADDQHPGWRAAGVTILIGEAGDGDQERLFVVRTDHRPETLPRSPSSPPGA